MGAQEGWHSHTAAPRHGVEAQGKAEQKAGQTSLLLTQGGRISSNTTAKWIDTNNEWTPGGVRAERCLLHCKKGSTLQRRDFGFKRQIPAQGKAPSVPPAASPHLCVWGWRR